VGPSTPSATDRLRAEATGALGRNLTEDEVVKFSKYLELLVKWQKAQRLVGSPDPGWIVEHLFLDSLLFVPLLPVALQRVMDVGSGAGVPGIPLKIVLPDTAFTLLEARSKRASFLSTVVRELELRQCEVLNARLDAIGPERAGSYDAVVMRCAGDPGALSGSVLPLLRPGGVMIASGPPRPRPTALGAWRVVEGPSGARHFWVHHKGDA
jgi:16S rRNA (guanine527-N7)-methyltransferase